MKIAFLNISQGRVNRGAEVYVGELAKRVAKKHKVKVYSSFLSLPPRWPIFWRLFIDPQGIMIGLFTLSLLYDLWRNKYDVIIPVNGGWQPAFIRIFTWVRGGKMVISGQSGVGWDDRNNLWCFPDCFISLTKMQENWAHRINPFVRVVTIPNGVDVQRFSSHKNGYPVELSRPVVLCVAALVPSKRIELTIQAVSQMNLASLMIIGKGPLKDKIHALGNKLLGNRFFMTDVSHDKMPSIYKSADVFTLASESSESFGIVYVEALASSLPVVATDDQQRREILEDAGLYVNPTHIQEYSKALEKALQRKDLVKLINQAKKYDWKIIAAKYEILFEKMT